MVFTDTMSLRVLAFHKPTRSHLITYIRYVRNIPELCCDIYRKHGNISCLLESIPHFFARKHFTLTCFRHMSVDYILPFGRYL